MSEPRATSPQPFTTPPYRTWIVRKYDSTGTLTEQKVCAHIVEPYGADAIQFIDLEKDEMDPFRPTMWIRRIVFNVDDLEEVDIIRRSSRSTVITH